MRAVPIGTGLKLRKITSQKRAAFLRRACIQAHRFGVSLNSRLGSNEERERESQIARQYLLLDHATSSVDVDYHRVSFRDTIKVVHQPLIFSLSISSGRRILETLTLGVEVSLEGTEVKGHSEGS